MSNIHQLPNQYSKANEEMRVEHASDWIAKLDRGLSNDEKSALQQWLAAHPKNTKVLLEVANLWDKMDDLSRLSDLFPQPVVRQHKRTPWLTAIAATVVLAVTVGLLQFSDSYFPFGKNAPNGVIAIQANYQTGIGESNTINLPDKSTIALNTNSFVQVKYTEHARIIELQRGEIHIDVAHDKTRPLSVIAGGKVIQAVGTAFNVEVRNELVELIVTDGKVLVAKTPIAHENTIEEAIRKLPQSAMAISKGEKVDLTISGQQTNTVVKVNAVDIAASLSWRNGNLIFRGESLAEAMAEISRYTNIEFELANNEALQSIEVAGMFKTGDVNGLLEVLARNFNISHERIDDHRIVLNYAEQI
ncbi:FecR family protein [Thalassotalea atypica]|uniref:FecR family protein n=1 Tax=Thalassotalea atypica TaxID=2054316 RepID=UPI002573D933|nr:FecR domain-containing protein [Thalassotalea atypica]